MVENVRSEHSGARDKLTGHKTSVKPHIKYDYTALDGRRIRLYVYEMCISLVCAGLQQEPPLPSWLLYTLNLP